MNSMQRLFTFLDESGAEAATLTYEVCASAWAVLRLRGRHCTYYLR